MSSSSGLEPEASRPSWWRLDDREVASALEVSLERGLTAEEAARRLERDGPNRLAEAKRRGKLALFFAQLSDFMILVLLAAALVSGLLGELVDAAAIVTIVLMNAVIGFAQEVRAERAMEALRAMAAPTAHVRRDGRRVEIDAETVVPGDVLLLETGNVIAADVRIVETASLAAQEAALTGESEPVGKRSGALALDTPAVADRANMAFKGTTVARGHGEGVVVATGMGTELGRIAGLLQEHAPTSTPLQRRLGRFGRNLAWVILGIAALLFGIGLLRDQPVLEMFLVAVSLAVAAIPEALPAVVTVSLALGARQMVRKNALVRRLSAVEALGSVTYICSDKTGTLTENRMHVETLVPVADAQGERLLLALALNNDVVRRDDDAPTGDPTEVALFLAAAERGFDRSEVERAHPRLAEIPFESERKLMTTFHGDGERVVAFVKGAPEAVIERCAPSEALDDFLERARTLAERGQRVLAVAERRFERLPEDRAADRIEQELELLGLVALIDPPRAEVPDAVLEARRAGIVPVMITGDHPATARAIASRIGVLEPGDEVVTGRELRALADGELEARAAHLRAYARVDPEQKIDIVRALQERGELVAMTGDGVNDAPALQRADVGVAMGLIGTDVAREASALVLLDDNFATIVTAVREGRRIFDNILKFVRFVLGGNLGEILTVFLGPLVGLPLPLVPVQILWVNLVTDGLPGLALAPEAAEPGIMERPPRPPERGIFSAGMVRHVLYVGALIGALTLGTEAVAVRLGVEAWQTMVFSVLTFAQLAHVLVIRTGVQSIFTAGMKNPLMGWSILLTFAVQLAAIYLPFLQAVLGTRPLSLGQLALCVGLAFTVVPVVEVEKLLLRRAGRRTME